MLGNLIMFKMSEVPEPHTSVCAEAPSHPRAVLPWDAASGAGSGAPGGLAWDPPRGSDRPSASRSQARRGYCGCCCSSSRVPLNSWFQSPPLPLEADVCPRVWLGKVLEGHFWAFLLSLCPEDGPLTFWNPEVASASEGPFSVLGQDRDSLPPLWPRDGLILSMRGPGCNPQCFR